MRACTHGVNCCTWYPRLRPLPFPFVLIFAAKIPEIFAEVDSALPDVLQGGRVEGREGDGDGDTMCNNLPHGYKPSWVLQPLSTLGARAKRLLKIYSKHTHPLAFGCAFHSLIHTCRLWYSQVAMLQELLNYLDTHFNDLFLDEYDNASPSYIRVAQHIGMWWDCVRKSVVGFLCMYVSVRMYVTFVTPLYCWNKSSFNIVLYIYITLCTRKQHLLAPM